MDEVDVATELEGVVTVGHGENVRELDAVLIRLSDAGQSVGHAVGGNTHADRGAGRVGAGGLEVTTVLEVDLVDRALANLGGEAGDQEALMVAGGSVGGRRAVGEGVAAAVAVGGIEVDEVVVDEGVVFGVDVDVDTGEEEVFFLEAGGSANGIGQQEADGIGALRGGDAGSGGEIVGAVITGRADDRALVGRDHAGSGVKTARG